MLKRFDPLYWKHAIWKFFSGVAIVVLGGLMTVIPTWKGLSPEMKTVAILGLCITTIKAIDMLFDQTMSRLAAGKPPFQVPGQNGHDTAHIQKPPDKI